MKTKSFLLLCILSVIFSCGKPAESTNTATDAAAAANEPAPAYELTDVPGTDMKKAVQKDASGKITEEGLLRDGNKEGTWLTYQSDPEKPFPQKMISYADGKYNGPYLEFTDNGSISLKAFYVDNKLDGGWGKYRFGRIESDAQYKNGQLEGLFREFNFKDGKLKKEIYYKNGLQDGPMRFYDEEEKMTIEFIYKNGEKVGGGESQK